MNHKFLNAISLIPVAVAGLLASTGAAEAATLNGSITINGNMTASKSGSNVVIDFQDVDGILGDGSFAAFSPNLSPVGANKSLGTSGWDDPIDGVGKAIINIKDLTLTSPSINGAPANYKTAAVTSFLNFGQRTLGSEIGNLTFDLDATDFIVSFLSGNFVGDLAFPSATGKWKFNGNTLADGTITGGKAGTSASYTISFDAKSVPEPASLLGLGIAGLALAGTRRRKNAKN